MHCVHTLKLSTLSTVRCVEVIVNSELLVFETWLFRYSETFNRIDNKKYTTSFLLEKHSGSIALQNTWFSGQSAKRDARTFRARPSVWRLHSAPLNCLFYRLGRALLSIRNFILKLSYSVNEFIFEKKHFKSHQHAILRYSHRLKTCCKTNVTETKNSLFLPFLWSPFISKLTSRNFRS